MQMSEVLGRPVVDAAGTRIGQVTDVRLVQDGPFIDGFGLALRVDALVVGRGGVASRLGYVRGGVRGPWLLRVMAAALEGRAFLVPWSDVTADDAGFTVNRTRAQLQRLADAYGDPSAR
jgi:sporulation protein YlmC with PRC-barrel domain